MSLVGAAIVTVAAAVMVRRFYPDRIVPHEGQGHGPGAAPAPGPAVAPAVAPGGGSADATAA